MVKEESDDLTPVEFVLFLQPFCEEETLIDGVNRKAEGGPDLC